MRQEWDRFWAHQKGDVKGVSWSKKRIQNILDSYVHPGLKVLDAGCGSGYFSQYFIARGCETYTLDYSQDALNLAKKITKGSSQEYICADLLDEAFAKDNRARFDIIFSDGLFEHFSQKEQDRILKNFKQMEKSNGKTITFVPNKYTLWRVLQPFYMPGIKERPFSLSNLLALYRRNSFKIEAFGGINVLPVSVSPESLGRWFGMLVYCIGE